MTCVPISASNSFASVPAATRAAVSRARAFQDVARVVEAVLLHPDEVGVAGPRLVQGLLGDARRGRHLLLPLRPLGVVDHDRDRRAEREAVPDPTEDLDVVALEAHPRPAAEAQPAAGQLVAQLLDGDGKTRRKPFDHHGERGAVRLAGGQVTQHGVRLPGWIERLAIHWRVSCDPAQRDNPYSESGAGQFPRYQLMIESPTRMAVSAPAARNGPNGSAWLRARTRVAIKTIPMIAP